MEDKDLRPKHYPKGQDTWTWAEKQFTKEQLIAICQFNIHKYATRKKGQDESDLKKIEHYTMWLDKILASVERKQTE